MPMPTSQCPSRTVSRRRAPTHPTETFGTFAQTTHQVALGERTVRLLGVNLGIVAHAKLHRIHAELLGQFVHRDLERHHSRRFAGGAHRIPFRQVQDGKSHRGETIGAGIQQSRLISRRLRLAVGKIA